MTVSYLCLWYASSSDRSWWFSSLNSRAILYQRWILSFELHCIPTWYEFFLRVSVGQRGVIMRTCNVAKFSAPDACVERACTHRHCFTRFAAQSCHIEQARTVWLRPFHLRPLSRAPFSYCAFDTSLVDHELCSFSLPVSAIDSCPTHFDVRCTLTHSREEFNRFGWRDLMIKFMNLQDRFFSYILHLTSLHTSTEVHTLCVFVTKHYFDSCSMLVR
jgi:hypothetical protein